MRTAAADAIADTAGANADTAGLLLLMLVIGTGGFPAAGIGAVAAAVPTVAAGLFSGIAVFAAACSSCCSRLTVVMLLLLLLLLLLVLPLMLLRVLLVFFSCWCYRWRCAVSGVRRLERQAGRRQGGQLLRPGRGAPGQVDASLPRPSADRAPQRPVRGESGPLPLSLQQRYLALTAYEYTWMMG